MIVFYFSPLHNPQPKIAFFSYLCRSSFTKREQPDSVVAALQGLCFLQGGFCNITNHVSVYIINDDLAV